MDARLESVQHDANVRGTEAVTVSADPAARDWVVSHWASLRDVTFRIILGKDLSAAHCKSLLTRAVLDAPEI